MAQGSAIITNGASGVVVLEEANSSRITGTVTVTAPIGGLNDDIDTTNLIYGGKGYWYHGWGFETGYDSSGKRIWILGQSTQNTGLEGNFIHYSYDGLNFSTIKPLTLNRHIHAVKYNPYNGWWYITDGDTPKNIYMTQDPQDINSYTKIATAGNGIGSSCTIGFTPQ